MRVSTTHPAWSAHLAGTTYPQLPTAMTRAMARLHGLRLTTTQGSLAREELENPDQGDQVANAIH